MYMKFFFVLTIFITPLVFSQEKTEKISFKKDVFPILRKKCLSCHNTEDESPSELYMEDYEQITRGDSRHGPVILPKKGEESKIIQKLRGTATFGKRMPRGRKPLDDEMIELISKWIDQGAKDN